MKAPILTVGMLLALLLLSFSPTMASGGDGGYAGSFLNLGVGARAIAMGKASSAATTGASALYWNPAGLRMKKGLDVSAMHAVIFQDRSENYFAMAYSDSTITIGLGWLHFGVDDIQQRTMFNSLISTFSDSEDAFMLGLGFPVAAEAGYELSLGVTLKHFRHSLFRNRATGWGADIGSLINIHSSGFADHLSFAVVLQNLNTIMRWDTGGGHEDAIPMTLRLGTAVKLKTIPAILALDIEKPEHREMKLHTGAEYAVQDFALRAGLDDMSLTAGAGFGFEWGRFDLVIDYAYTDDDISDKGLHFFSLGGRF